MTKQELASRIWAMANKMRTKIKANEYKDYILGFLFYKFLSDKEVDFFKQQGMTEEEFRNLGEADMDFVRMELGYAISYDNLFSSWQAMGIRLNARFVSEAIDAFYRNYDPARKEVFKDIFDTLQNGITKLGDSSGSRDKAVRDIVDMIGSIPSDKDSGYDVLGYIYEFLIYKFATAAKDDGAFYTPHEVSQLIAMIIAERCKGKDKLRVYDPTSGSGSLLRTIGEYASNYIDEDNILYYGQEKITETYHLTRMNLVMKGVNAQNIKVRNGDTLEDDWPYFDDDTPYEALKVDAVVSNPPYSLSWDPEPRALDERFKKYGLAPAGKADYAFLLHCLYHLDYNGTMAIVLPHGVLFRGDSEGEIRKNLCLEHNIETIIGLPANLFFATSIPTVIAILSKDRKSDDILFIDASKNFEKGKNQNVLRESDIKRIFDAVIGRKDIPGFARLVPLSEIQANDYNLNIPRYVSANDVQETSDFAALMFGLAPNSELAFAPAKSEPGSDFALGSDFACWEAFPSLKNELFEDQGNGYSAFRDVDIAKTVSSNKDIKAFQKMFDTRLQELFAFMKESFLSPLSDKPSAIKEKMTQKMFEMVKDIDVIDRYDVYQVFMNHWKGIESDMSLIRNDPSACRKYEPKTKLKKVGREEIEVPDGFRGTIFPLELVGETFFKDDYERVEAMRAQVSALESERDEIYESLDEDVKSAVGDGEKFKEADLKRYLKENPDAELQKALSCMGKIKEQGKKAKEAEEYIERRILEKIPELTDEEVGELLVEKWITPICKELSGMPKMAADGLAKRMTALKNKYGTTLAQIDAEIKGVSASLSEMLGQLVGSEMDMKALRAFQEVLNG